MTCHFGVLIPSTNTTVEIEYNRLLPPSWQAHAGRLLSRTPGQPFAASRNEDIEYQAQLLGTARVECVVLIQTSASLHTPDYDREVIGLIKTAAGVPALTSAVAIGEAVRALGARRVALVSPYSVAVNTRARAYFESQYGLEIVALEGFGATDSYAIGQMGPDTARRAFAKIDRPEIEAFILPGGNFPTMASIAEWERECQKPVVTTNQAALWAIVHLLKQPDRFPGLGRLLENMPQG